MRFTKNPSVAGPLILPGLAHTTRPHTHGSYSPAVEVVTHATTSTGHIREAIAQGAITEPGVYAVLKDGSVALVQVERDPNPPLRVKGDS